MSELRDLLDLPSEVKKSDFVVKLTEGISHPETLLRNYAVTPDLRNDYERALKLVESALRDQQSVGAYLHGSFGSGKSHFMAVLSLILGGHTAPWQEPEFHEVLAPHEWLRDKNLLRLHFHMLGANSIEEKVFSEYIARVAEAKPDALVPPLFEDQPLFENAQALRHELGEDAFFKKLNATGGERKGWGKLAAGAAWDGPAFDAARQGSNPDERSRLFSSLVKTLFPAFAQNRSGYLGFDAGLGIMCRHAASLGYVGIVLFLDELILWLASRAADRVWLNSEAAKIGKLVEAQDERREVPVISFIARQRDISELVGEDAAGAQAQNLRDSFTYSSGRFDTIRLEDRNLPAIVEKRVVRKKSAAAEQRLNDAFDQMRRSLGAAWATLLGEFGDEKSFRQVYPFTPALLEALVALSHYLQRERTALRILMEMLVDHLHDFSIGKVVSVGDLFDVLAGAEEPMDGTMRAHFAAAKRLYNSELLPLVRRTNETDSRDKCQRMRNGHPLAIGCSNCLETRCRADNRLLKTLLLAALVPKCPAFSDMTASRLVQLNHGTLKSIVPGRETADAVARLRHYAAEVGKLRVGEQDDPSISVVLEGVDLKPILESAGVHLNENSRRAKLREIMTELLDLPAGATLADHTVTWRGMDRDGKVQFGNVRVMDDLTLIGDGEGDFRAVIDYPFDEPGHTPHEDEARVQAYLEMGKPAPAIVWLPSFFGEKLDRDLGELVLIDEVLRDWKRYLENLRPEEQGTARLELENLGSQKRQRVRRALSSAYGVSMQAEGELDPARSIQRHFFVLTPGMTIPPSLQAGLRDALTAAIHELLEQRWPRHPKFDGRVTSGRLRKALDRFYDVCQAENQRIAIDQAERADLRIPEALGIATVTESSAALRLHVFQEADNRLRADGIETPTVGRVKRAFDPEGLMGLTTEVADFLVLAYAAATGHELQRGAMPIEPILGKLPIDGELVKPRLPGAPSWQRALDLAGKLFGISVGGKALNARNLRTLFDRLHEEWKKARNSRASEVADVLLRRAEFFSGDPPRLATARKIAELLGHLAHSDPVDVVESLAGLQPATSADAMARQIRDAAETVRMLGDDLVFGTFTALRSNSDPEAARLLEDVRAVLEADQFAHDLAPRLRELALHAQAILRLATPPPPPPHQVVVDENRGEGFETLQGDIPRIRTALTPDGTKLVFDWKVVRTKP